MFKNLLSLFLSYSTILFSYEYELVICAIFQNDAPYLKEWIDFHEKQGVQHFYLYNNNSTDEFLTELKDFINRGKVSLFDWPYDYKNMAEWIHIQCSAYMDCVNKIRSKVKWCAFLDTDEFLFCTNKENMVKYLDKFDTYGALAVRWRIYGTSNKYLNKHDSLLNNLTMRAVDDFESHFIYKTIANPKCIKTIVNPHFATLNANKIFTDEYYHLLSQDCDNKYNSADFIRINHYWSRDMNFFYNQKLPRRSRWYREDSIRIEKSMNEVYDPILANPNG